MQDLPPHIQVLLLARSYVGPRALHVIAELGVADALDDVALGAADLASATGANADALNRLMRLLVSHGIFEAQGALYAHNEASRFLRTDHPLSARPFVLMIGSRTNWKAFEELIHSARTGETGMEKVFGESHFPYLAKHPDESSVFNAAMAAKSAAEIPAVLEAYYFGGFEVIADIGGGRGHLLSAILELEAGLKGVLFDLPQVVAEAEAIASDRLTLQGGSFFDDALPVANAYLLWNILHDWPDADCVSIVSAIRRAAPDSARLLVLETLLPAGPEPSPVKGLDIMMMAMNGGRERTEEEYRALLAQAGFQLDKVFPTATGLCVIEALAI